MKKIILLSDGTGNSAAKRNKTNVWRLYRALDLHRKDQIALYDDGVGSQQFLLFKLLGGAFGWGLRRNVIELYKFLCRNYEHQDSDGKHDKIYLFGFSRGAFTVRVLAGLIKECGLFTNHCSERDLDKKARQCFSQYRATYPRWYSGLFTRKHAQENAHSALQPKIEFIGVWDTVAAYGLPVDELTILFDKLIFPMRFPDRKLSDEVEKACHAISVDDERHTFHPVLWNEENESDPNRIEQVWFPGVHSDVGGGYPRYELSLISLDWMISKVEASDSNKSGLHFRDDLRNEYRCRSDWHGSQHDSRAGLAAYYRYKPRFIETLCNDSDAGVKVSEPKIHCSVFERIRGNIVPYAPTGLPNSYEIVWTRGKVTKYETDDQKAVRAKAMNGAWNIIFWRRWLYAAFLLATVAPVSSRFTLKWEVDAPCTERGCLLDPILVFVSDLIPDFLAGWIEAMRQNQMWLVAFVVLFGVLSVLKPYSSAATLVRATTAWSHLNGVTYLPCWPSTATAKLRALSDGEVGRKIRWLWWAIVFLIVLGGIIWAVDRTSFHVRDSMGWLCQSSDTTNQTTDRVLIDFDASNPCLETQVTLMAGRTYLFDVHAELPWMDGEIQAGPDGLESTPPLAVRLFAPLRRRMSRPWFELTGRVGHSGRETFTIGSMTCYRAQSDGKLYLYVNDAVFGLLPDSHWAVPYFWSIGRNSGKAAISITPVGPSSTCEQSESCEVYCPAQ